MASSAPWQRRSSKAVSSDTAKTSSRGSTTRRRPLSASCRERISGSFSCASAPIRRGEQRKHKMTARDSSRFLADDSDLPENERQLLGRARVLIPHLAERAPATTAERNVPPETIAEYHDAGILKILQPRRFGGLQGRFSLFSQIVEELTYGCASSAWVYAVLGEHQWIIASYPEQAQIDVWGDDPDAVAASSLAPRAAATPVPGGWRLSGHYSFARGCKTMAGSEVGQLPIGEAAAAIDAATLLLRHGRRATTEAVSSGRQITAAEALQARLDMVYAQHQTGWALERLCELSGARWV